MAYTKIELKEPIFELQEKETERLSKRFGNQYKYS